MDMEVQYVTSGHEWYRDSFENPESPFGEYILYNDAANTQPEPFFPGFLSLPMYDGDSVEVATLNFDSPALRSYLHGLFRYWVDPDGDGSFEDGVDGFRLDHIMDDLDWKGRQTELFTRFWQPLFRELKVVNPDLLMLGEQARWDYGEDVLERADADAVFGFPLSFGIRTLDKRRLEGALDTTFQVPPTDGHVVIFAENHDMDRLASIVDEEEGALRLAAALNLLSGGIPILYYGQEIGMRGVRGAWGNDGNDIPIREAFEWHEAAEGAGTALWYRESGPWWETSTVEASDGISVEEQRRDSTSLWHHYRRLIGLRKSVPALSRGSTHIVSHDSPDVLAFRREDGLESVLMVLNLRGERAEVQLEEELAAHPYRYWPGSTCGEAGAGPVGLLPHQIAICGTTPLPKSD